MAQTATVSQKWLVTVGLWCEPLLVDLWYFSIMHCFASPLEEEKIYKSIIHTSISYTHLKRHKN